MWYCQGYMIFQVQIPVDNFDPSDPDIARLVIQTDIGDEIDDLYNSVFDADLDDCVTAVSVEGANGGLANHVVVSSEMWAGEFVSGEVYCYAAIAYVANVNGVNDVCPNQPFQFYPGGSSAAGKMLMQCDSS
ncbi:MAG: hypothetical protein ACI84C_000203 [Flavobacteriales bacterium]|jgi:hypothetical protein